MDKQTKQAVENAASHICDILNTSLAPLMSGPITPERLIYLLVTSEEEIPDGKQDESMGTIRGLMQRLYHLKEAVQGRPGSVWARYWAKGRLHLLEDQEKVS